MGLAVVFLVAGTAKLADRAGAERTVAAFGVPPPLRPATVTVVCVAELVVAALLLLPGAAVVGAAAAAGLLGVFLVALGVQYMRGVEVPCACFGQLAATPAGVRTLVRNVGLGVAALFVLSQVS